MKRQPKPPKQEPMARTPGGGFYVQGGYESAYDGHVVSLMRLERQPRFVPSHKAQGWNEKGQREWIEPDTINGQHTGFKIKKGETEFIRMMDDPDAVKAIETLDAEEETFRKRLKAIQEERQQVFIDNWVGSKRVTISDCRTI